MIRPVLHLFQRRHAAWWTLLAGLAITGALTWTLHHEAIGLDRRRLAQRAAEIKSILDARLERSEMLLHNLRDYLTLSREDRNTVFEQWCYQNGLTINCPWILGIAVATNCNTRDLTSALPPHPATWTEPQWIALHPIVVANPIECRLSLRSIVTNGNQFLEDYDLRCADSDHANKAAPSRRHWLASAVRGARLGMGERQPVMRDPRDQPIIGTAFYVPIYRRELDPYLTTRVSNEAFRQFARWLHLSALIVAPVDFNRLVSKQEAEAADLGIEIFSSTNHLNAGTWMNPDRPTPRADDPNFDTSLTHRQIWPMYGQRFSLFFYTKPLFEAQSPRRLAKIAGWAGFAVTLLATALVGVSVRARNRQDRLTGQIREARDALAGAQRERERISRDLHDGTIQSLYAIQLGLGHTAQRLRSAPDHAGSELSSVRKELNAVIAEIRQFITAETAGEARTPVDLCAVLQVLAQRAGVGNTTRILLNCDATASNRVTPDQAVQLANIAREALSNALRHGQPQRIDLSLRLVEASVELEVADDGKGFSAEARRGSGLGLSSMTARAQESGGTLEVDSSPGRGTRVVAKLPVQPTETADNPDGTGDPP